jgi:hypothetical protein
VLTISGDKFNILIWQLYYFDFFEFKIYYVNMYLRNLPYAKGYSAVPVNVLITKRQTQTASFVTGMQLIQLRDGIAGEPRFGFRLLVGLPGVMCSCKMKTGYERRQ